MKRIIFTHGKNPKPPPAEHRRQLLRCLLHGVRKVDPAVADEIAAGDRFTLVSWSHLFYDRVRDITEDLPWIERLLQETDPPLDLKAVRPLKYRTARAMYVAGDRLPWLIPLIPDRRVKLSIRDTARYFENRDNIACHTRRLHKQPLRAAAEQGDCVLLIGHSMGSVIAYDALWELDHLEGHHSCINRFLTLGSPLGMNYVQSRLLGCNERAAWRYPCNIREWINVSSRGDLVALDPSLANDFHAMIEGHCVENITDMRDSILNHYRDSQGPNVHKSYGYLVNPAVGKIIADWWKRA